MIEETNQNTYQYHYRNLIDRLPNELTQDLLLGSLQCLDVKDNKARLHFFAYGIREIINALLEHYAPDSEVLKSHWYKKPENDIKITRAQRVQYAIMGGISEQYIATIIFFDFSEISKEIINKVKSANDLVHLNDKKLVSEPEKVEAMAEELLDILFSFLDAIEETKEDISLRIEDYVYDILENIPDKIHNNRFYEVTSYTYPYLGDIENQQCEVMGIDSKEVSIRFTADVELEVQTKSTCAPYEVRNTFPVVLEYTASVDDFSNLTLKNSQVDEDKPKYIVSEDDDNDRLLSAEIARLVSKDRL